MDPRSFCAGYVAVRSGFIKKELTNREIEKLYPKHNPQAFSQGMIDALKNDSWRYRGLRREAGIETGD